MNNNSDIDLVYLWVDDSDLTWKKRKQDFENQNNIQAQKQDKDANSPCRFSNNDELKYSLRSVEKNIPWINKIYIVSDNQVPQWLDLDNEKIKIVNHSDIIPKEKLPLYNACAIEARIPYIEGLSEKFIYANDDMLFWEKTSPEFFFEGDKPIYIAGEKILWKKYKSLYGGMVTSAYKMVKSRFGADIPYFPHHNADPYRKSLFLDCIKEFQKEFDETLNNHFRAKNDMQRSVVMYYSIAKGGALLKKNQNNPFLNFFLRKPYSSQYINVTHSALKRVKNMHCNLLCVNDCRKTTFADRKELKKVLNNKFSEKSRFEK